MIAIIVHSGSEWNERKFTDAGIQRKSMSVPATITSHARHRAHSAQAKMPASHGGANMTLVNSAISRMMRKLCRLLLDDIYKIKRVEVNGKTDKERLRCAR